MLAKFHGNILNLSENIAKSFRGATFFDSHCIIRRRRRCNAQLAGTQIRTRIGLAEEFTAKENVWCKCAGGNV